MIRQSGNRFRSCVLFLSVLWACVAFSCVCPSCLNQEREPVPVTILFFNDIHGHLMPFSVSGEAGKQEVAGVARLATLMKDIRQENDGHGVETLVLISGDILQGTPMSTVFKGEPDMKCFRAMGADAIAVGNHEFDFGLENFLNLQRQADFPFISANIFRKDTGQRLCDPVVFFQLAEGLTLTVVGVTTADLLKTTKAVNVEKLTVTDPVRAVGEALEQFKSLGPVVVLSHCGYKTDVAIAEAYPEISAVIGGHDHILLPPDHEVAEVPIFQAFENGRYLGRIDFLVEPGDPKAELLFSEYVSVTADIPPDPEIDAIVTPYAESLKGHFKKVIGEAVSFLDGERERVRHEETALGNFVTDIMREYTGADIALINAGALRASIDIGPVRIEDIFKAVPYSDEIKLVTLSGADLLKVLSRSVQAQREAEDGGFLQVSGMFFDIRDDDAVNVSVGKKDRPLDPEASYTVAIPDFLATGGDGYALFIDKDKVNTRLPLRELIVETVKERGVISAQKEGRINRIR